MTRTHLYVMDRLREIYRVRGMKPKEWHDASDALAELRHWLDTDRALGADLIRRAKIAHDGLAKALGADASYAQ